MNHQNCSLCSSLKDYERGDQKSGEGTFLPQAANSLVALYDLQPHSFDLGGNPPLRVNFSREVQLQECPQCQTCYLYREDYEFLWGGTEDEQVLQRLTDEQLLACLEKLELTMIRPVQPFQPAPQMITEVRASKAPGENKNYMVKILEDALKSRDKEEMEAALKKMDDQAYYYPQLLPILERIAGAAFYKFDDNGAGGFPRPDVSLEYSYKADALSAIEKIKKNTVFESGSGK